MDFTTSKYKHLLTTLINKGYEFQTFKSYLINPKKKVVVLRHDVDTCPENSLIFAKIQYEKGVRGSYYFRITSSSWNEDIIKEISSMGHEIGYHYENMDHCNGNVEDAYLDFKNNLINFRKICEIKTICMHGSPLSKYDNKEIWKVFSYLDLDIIGEPYFDLDFDKIFYLTDVGRMWDGTKYSVRDKVNLKNSFPTFHNTNEIINSINNSSFPEIVMFNFHPQRWNNNIFFWFKEFVFQFIKNIIKKYFYVK